MKTSTEITLTSIAVVAEQEKVISAIKGQSKDLTEQKHTAKVTAYAELIGELVAADVKLSKAGNLPTKYSNAIKNQLEAESVNKATYDRYVQNTAGILNSSIGPELRGIDKNNAASEVLCVLDRHGLNAENKINKFWNKEVKDLIDTAAKAAAKKRFEIYKDPTQGPKELVRFDELQAEYFEAFKAEAEAKALEEAKAKADANAEAINQFGDDLELAS